MFNVFDLSAIPLVTTSDSWKPVTLVKPRIISGSNSYSWLDNILNCSDIDDLAQYQQIIELRALEPGNQFFNVNSYPFPRSPIS
jgi:hypothetical protein